MLVQTSIGDQCLDIIMGGILRFDVGALAATLRSTAGWAVLLVSFLKVLPSNHSSCARHLPA